tara:strand:- start:451 stop:1155 length:705 start_codon:yes stop_codon:yes gene_type:complete
MEKQHYNFHTLPSVFMLETHLPEGMVSTLNDYLDKLMIDENRKSHAGTLVGQIGHGQQLTMDHHCEDLEEFNRLIQNLAMDYVKKFFEITGNKLTNTREVLTDEVWSVHSYQHDYNPIHDHGTKTLMGVSCTAWTKVPQQILNQPTAGSPEYSLYNASGNSDGCLAFSYGRNSLIDVERLAPPQNVVVKPEVGKLLMFPSWLSHMVYPFEGEGERRTVAANLNVWKVEDDGTRH